MRGGGKGGITHKIPRSNILYYSFLDRRKLYFFSSERPVPEGKYLSVSTEQHGEEINIENEHSPHPTPPPPFLLVRERGRVWNSGSGKHKTVVSIHEYYTLHWVHIDKMAGNDPLGGWNY